MFWNVVTAVVIIAALAAVSEALAVSVVTAAMVCWLAVAVVRAVRR